MNHKRQIAQAAVLGVAVGVVASSILGALHAPTGLNVAAALTLTLALLIEAPLTAMALGKHRHH